jgi:hypothetical protein
MAHEDAGAGEIELRATTPDGKHYSIASYTGTGVAGPASVAAEPGSPGWAHALARLVNRGLRLVPRGPTEEPATFLYVFDGEGRQVCMIFAHTRADAARKAEQLVTEIRSGSFDPRAQENWPPAEP